ncbi:MAG TPA: hypothetical protein VK324_09970 [Tepidisphaeraceae bacterium]|nr:hypothetical protein [Tepidisphaeraceae bacterium]
MKDPREYLNEIRANLEKIRAQKGVTPAESALFGMVDGLAGLQLTMLERLTALEQVAGLQPPTRRPPTSRRRGTAPPGTDGGTPAPAITTAVHRLADARSSTSRPAGR